MYVMLQYPYGQHQKTKQCWTCFMRRGLLACKDLMEASESLANEWMHWRIANTKLYWNQKVIWFHLLCCKEWNIFSLRIQWIEDTGHTNKSYHPDQSIWWLKECRKVMRPTPHQLHGQWQTLTDVAQMQIFEETSREGCVVNSHAYSIL